MTQRANVKAIVITFLTTALLFIACGLATPMLDRTTITVHYIR